MAFIAKNKKTIDLLIPLSIAGMGAYTAYKKKLSAKQIAIGSAIIFLIIWLITKTITKSLSEAELSAATEKAVAESATNVQQQLGLDETTINKVKDVAQRVYRAFHDSWDEDEAAALAAANSLNSVTEVTATCTIYQTAYGKSFKSDFQKYVQWWDGIPKSLVYENWF